MTESIGLTFNHYFRSKEHTGNRVDYKWRQCLYRRYRMFHADIKCNGPKSMLCNFDVKVKLETKHTWLIYLLLCQEGFSKRLVDYLELDIEVGNRFPHCNKAGEVDTVIGSIWAGSEYEKLVREELNLYMAKHDLQL